MTRPALPQLAGLTSGSLSRAHLLVLAFLALVNAGCGGAGGGGGSPQAAGPGLVYADGDGAWFAPLDGSGPVSLASPPDSSVFPIQVAGSWLIYYVQPHDSAHGTTWAVRTDGTGRVQLGSGLDVLVLDGRAVVLQQGDSTHPDLIVSVELSTGVSTTLGEAPGVSPAAIRVYEVDGKLYLSTTTNRSQPGTGELVSIAPDGSRRTVLLERPAVPTVATATQLLAYDVDDPAGYERHLYLLSLDGAVQRDLGVVGEGVPWGRVGELEGHSGPFLVGAQAYLAAWDVTGQTSAAYAVDMTTGALATLVVGYPKVLEPWMVLNGKLIADLGGQPSSLASVDGASHAVTPFPSAGLGSTIAGTLLGRVIYQRQTSDGAELVSALADGTGAAVVAATPYGVGAPNARGPAAGLAVTVGDRLVFAQAVDGQVELVSALVDGSGRIVISQGPGTKGLEAVVGDVLVYRSTVAGAGSLYAVRADGTGHVALAATAADERYVAAVGSTLVFEQLSQAGGGTLQAVPLIGGAAVQLGTVSGAVYAAP
jgi:hypothetical protein